MWSARQCSSCEGRLHWVQYPPPQVICTLPVETPADAAQAECVLVRSQRTASRQPEQRWRAAAFAWPADTAAVHALGFFRLKCPVCAIICGVLCAPMVVKKRLPCLPSPRVFTPVSRWGIAWQRPWCLHACSAREHPNTGLLRPSSCQ